MTDEAILNLTSHPSTREDGFRSLVVTYQERLYHHIRRQVGSHEDADDVLQNTFLKVFRHLESFEGRSGLYTWLYRIASNEIANHHQRQKRVRVVEMSELKPVHADSYLDTDGLEEALEEMVMTLPERQQMVFRMRYYDEMSYKDMAGMLHLTEGALKASFHHAVKKIEELLKARQIV